MAARNWFDRFLARIGLQRTSGRMASYSGAYHSRLTEDWILASLRSADEDLKGGFATLRARARDLARNDPYAKRFLGMVAENVVGHRGIRLQAQVKRPNGAPDTVINGRIEAAWRRWGKPETASVDGRLSWVDIQALAIQGVIRDGEALVRGVPQPDNPFGFALQLLDPDQLDHEFNRPAGNGQAEIRMGVEIDAWGRPVAYWLWNGHPSDANRQNRVRERVPAEQIRHLYLTERPGQTRGVTAFAPVLMGMRMRGGYQEAELVAARTAAAKMGFFLQSPDAVPDPYQSSDGDVLPMEAEPGRIDTLPPGVTFQAWDPQHPNTSFRDFNKAILQSIATGLGVSYNALANDLEGVNYSSIRAGLLAERDVWRRLQQWLAEQLHDWVYPQWLRWALTTGALELPSRNTSRWLDVVWMPRGWAWVDPLKDIQASAFAVGMRVDSLTRIAAEQGRDVEEVFAEIRRELDLMEAYGIRPKDDPTPQETITSEEKDTESSAFSAELWRWLRHPSTNGHALTNGKGR